MKRVFQDISEISHLWASQAQEDARNPGHNFYFYGLTIYSYGSHFPIAQIYDKDNSIVFMTTNSYSVTTSKHINTVHYAINHKTVFNVPNVKLNGTFKDHKKNVVHYLDTIEELIGKQKRARKYDYMGNIGCNLDELQRYVKLFKLRSMLTKAEKELLDITNVNDLFEGCDFTELRVKRAKAETRKQTEAAKKRLFEWLGYRTKYVKGKVYLRLKGDMIETSQHASVPAREAKILFYRIKEGKDVKGFKIGYHTVISINGTLKIGCHEITKDVIEDFAKRMNW